MKAPVILIATVLAVGLGMCPERSSRQSSVVSLQSGIENEEGIACVPLPGEPLDIKSNTIYAPAFRAAWTLLVTDILGEYVKTVESVPLADSLNLAPYHPEAPGDWVVEAGNVKEGVIERIKQSLMYKFSETYPELDKWRKEEDAVICYSRLVKVMAFKFPFETLEWKFYAEEDAEKVYCFGITKKRSGDEIDRPEMRRQVTIHDYRHPDDFIITLSTADPNTEIVLAKIQPENNLREMVATVNQRIEQSFPEEFSGMDELMVPKVRLEANRTFQELINRHLANTGYEDWFFAEARQSVDFSLDESGALAKATGEIVKIKGPTSRIYAFDKPYLIICRDKDSKEPDIVAWISNTDVMQKLP